MKRAAGVLLVGLMVLSVMLALGVFDDPEPVKETPPKVVAPKAGSAPVVTPGRRALPPPTKPPDARVAPVDPPRPPPHRVDVSDPAKPVYVGLDGTRVPLPVDGKVTVSAVAAGKKGAHVGVATDAGTITHMWVAEGGVKATRRVKAEIPAEQIDVRVVETEIEVRYGNPDDARNLRTSTTDPTWWVQGPATGWGSDP